MIPTIPSAPTAARPPARDVSQRSASHDPTEPKLEPVQRVASATEPRDRSREYSTMREPPPEPPVIVRSSSARVGTLLDVVA